MKIIRPGDPLPPREDTVVSVGNFDGVHRGHTELVRVLTDRAKKLGARAAVVTFEPHTRTVVRPDTIQPILTTFDEKIMLFTELGIDLLVCLPFNTDMAAKPPEVFVRDVLKKGLGTVEWIMGANHAFGKGAAGSQMFLQKERDIYHINTLAVDLSSESTKVISSTEIRAAVSKGRMEEATGMLGHPYLLVAERVEGIKKGSELGFPTLNFAKPASAKVKPPPGVYAAELETAYLQLRGALYFGDCPTFGHRDIHFEFHSIDKVSESQAAPIGTNAAIWAKAFVRIDEMFDSSETLVKNIKKDIQTVQSYFAED